MPAHRHHPVTVSALLCGGALLLLGACATTPIHVLEVPPQAAYRTLGMVSGQGPNEPAALEMALRRASQLEADAVIVVGRRPVGQTVIVTCRAIRYLAPPPAP